MLTVHTNLLNQNYFHMTLKEFVEAAVTAKMASHIFVLDTFGGMLLFRGYDKYGQAIRGNSLFISRKK